MMCNNRSFSCIFCYFHVLLYTVVNKAYDICQTKKIYKRNRDVSWEYISVLI